MCPFDCVFCTRRRVHGTGRHINFALYESLIRQLRAPERICLNHSGESIHYPRLGDAIRIAKAAGAATELVTALCSAPESTVRELLDSGLDHLRISLHAVDAGLFREIYRFSSWEAMKRAIARLLELRAELGAATAIDFAFVAIDRNVEHLPDVAAYVESVGGRLISILPVTQRDVPEHPFTRELDGIRLTPEFRRRLQAAIARSRESHPAVEIQVVNPDACDEQPLGETPCYYPALLPDDGRIAGCDENPWDTMHVLADGRVLPCGEHARDAMGDLNCEAVEAIWHGERYRRFRGEYSSGKNALCRCCPCKIAYRPEPLAARVSCDRDSAQFVRGWHALEPDGARWSRPEAVLWLGRKWRSNRLHIRGILPPGRQAGTNRLTVSCDGMRVGEVINATSGPLPFDERFPLACTGFGSVAVNLETNSFFCPPGADRRLLGFALIEAETI